MDLCLGPPNGSVVESPPGSNIWTRFFGGNRTHWPTVVEWADDERQTDMTDPLVGAATKTTSHTVVRNSSSEE